MLRAHMPELMPAYERVVELAGGGDLAARMLSLYKPPPYLAACSQGAWVREGGPVLARNYDYAPGRFEGLIWSTRLLERRVIGTSDPVGTARRHERRRPRGLAHVRRATCDGRRVRHPHRRAVPAGGLRDGAQARDDRPLPSASRTTTIVDRAGDVVTAYVSPDRDPIFRPFPAATNHQGLVEVLDQAKATRTIEREQCIVRLVEGDAPDVEAFAGAFLRSPLFSTSYANGWEPLRPRLPALRRCRRWSVGDRLVAARVRGLHEGRARRGARRRPLGERSAASGTRAEAAMRTETFRMETGGRACARCDRRVARFAADVDDDGLLHVFVPHATAGVALMETGAARRPTSTSCSSGSPATTATRIGMGRSATAATICSRSSRRRWSCPWWGARCSWASGSRSCWSTRTARTTFGPCGSASCPAEPLQVLAGARSSPGADETACTSRSRSSTARHRRARPPGPTRAGTARGRLPSPPPSGPTRATSPHARRPGRRRGRRDQEAARALALAALGVPHHQAVTREPDRRPDALFFARGFPLRGCLGAGLLRRARVSAMSGSLASATRYDASPWKPGGAHPRREAARSLTRDRPLAEGP